MDAAYCTAKWLWDSSIFSSIKPKHDKQLFVYFCVFPVLTWIYLFCLRNCFHLMFRTILVAKQLNSCKNGEKHKSKHTISCHVLDNWRKYGSVSYSLSCTTTICIKIHKFNPLSIYFFRFISYNSRILYQL